MLINNRNLSQALQGHHNDLLANILLSFKVSRAKGQSENNATCSYLNDNGLQECSWLIFL